MNELEQEESASFQIELSSGTDLVLDKQRRFNGGYLFLQDIYYRLELHKMDFLKYEGKGYQPIYTRTELTDALHEVFGFCTSKQIVPMKKMRNICAKTKKPEE